MNAVEKNDVARLLREHSAYLQLKGENFFKTRAYDVAADRVQGLAEELSVLIAENRLSDIPGIGESIASKIIEYAKTGQVAAFDEVRNAYPATILELMTVQDLGPKKAKALFEQLGVGSIDQLEQACKDQKVRALKGFGQKTEEKLLAGIELARRTKASGARKLLWSVLPEAEKVLAWVRGAKGVVRASLGGSVRRRKETVADVDIIASAAEAAPVFEHFKTYPGVAQVIGEGESKCSIRLKEEDLQIDLRVLPDVDFASALHHFTGSKAHHIRLRGMALDKGLTISEWGVFRMGDKEKDKEKPKEPTAKGVAKHETAEQKLTITDEADIYALLDMQYVPPELREDAGEIEAALAKALPELVGQPDIRGNIHCHSTWSDGRNSLAEMAHAAQAMGFTYMTVTEHSQTSAYARGLTLDQMKAQWDEIDALNESMKGFRLLKGIESDILEDGRLDYPESVLEKLDVVICSIHQRYSQDEDAMTKRVLNAFDNPFFQIWGHPTGRLINKRPPAPMRMEEILDKAAKNNIIIEINGCPDRMDFSPEHVRMALKRDLRLSVSTDAHSISELSAHLRCAVDNARRGWVRKTNVVNSADVNGFLRSLRKN